MLQEYAPEAVVSCHGDSRSCAYACMSQVWMMYDLIDVCVCVTLCVCLCVCVCVCERERVVCMTYI